jgi:hypothetical protein
MKITLDGLDGRNFTLRLPLDDNRGEHVIALHDTKRLRGLYDHDATRFSLDPVEADAIVGEVAWVLDGGSFHLAGPASLGATSIDLDIRRDDQPPAVTGEARCASLDAPVTRLHRAGLELYGALSFTALVARHDAAADVWAVTADTLGARTTSLAQEPLHARVESLDVRALVARLGGGTTALTLADLVVRDLTLTTGDTEVKAVGATFTGLRVTRDEAGLTLAADAVTLTDVALSSGRRRLRSPSLHLGSLRYAPDGVSFDRLAADELSFAIEGLGEGTASPEAPDEPALGTRRTLGLDLPLLDHVDARIEADIVVDVKLPVIAGRVATHRLRLAIDDGALDFKQLERGLSRLEDAILDFEVVPEGLMLELDAVVVKRELLLWPLDAEGLRLARQNRVRLRTFAQPTMTVRPPSPRSDKEKEKESESAVALRRIEVQGLRIEGGVDGASTLPLAGGTLRLGADGVVALGRLCVTGSLLHDARTPTDTTLSIDLADLDAGLDAIAVGERRLDVARLRVGQLTEGRVTFCGFSPRAVTGTLRAVELTGLRLRGA